MRDINNNYDDFMAFLAESMEPIVRIMADPEVSAMVRAKKPKILIVKHLVGSHSDDVAVIAASMDGVSVEEFKGNFSAMKLVKAALSVIGSPVVKEVFRSAEQTVDATPSVSASENAGE